MRAAVCDQYGPPEVVRIDEVEKPSPQGGEVLIKVHATTVNRTDCGVRAPYHPVLARFFYGWARPRARVLGNEFAGEVEAVGVGVTSFKPGDRVFGFNAGFRGVGGAFRTRAASSYVTPAGMVAIDPPARVTRYSACAPGGDSGWTRRSRIRCDRQHRLLRRPVAEEHRCQGYRGLRDGPTWISARTWAPTGWSTSRPETSPTTSSDMTSSSTRSARPRSGAAAGC